MRNRDVRSVDFRRSEDVPSRPDASVDAAEGVRVTAAPARPRRVLITNRLLDTRTGTEIYVRDLAASLLQRGHLPIVYSPQLGEMAEEIRATTVPVVDDVAKIGAAPDIIHGHHGLETLVALLAFPGVPAVTVCHSWLGWPDAPVKFPRVARYVAVDHTVRDRLVFEHGIAEERIHVRLNAVDLSQFQPRGPLPPRPKRALVFSNAAGGSAPYLDAIARVCSAEGIALDVAGYRSGNVLQRPQDTLGQYDLVFAKAKAALEAAAVGTSVVLCDAVGVGPMITTRNLDQLRPLNFGMRTLREQPSVEALSREVARYDPADAAAVSRQVRAEAGHEQLVDEFLALYEDVLAERRNAVDDPWLEQRAAGLYLQSLAGPLHERDLLGWFMPRLLRIPFVRPLLRLRGGRERANHPLQQLLRTFDKT
jgi:glycosyl transferase family 4